LHVDDFDEVKGLERSEEFLKACKNFLVLIEIDRLDEVLRIGDFC